MEDLEAQNFASAILSAGMTIAMPRSPISEVVGNTINPNDGIPYVVIPDGHKIEDLERLLPIPTRHRGKITMLDAESFIAYAKDQGSLKSCKLYADVDYEASKCTIVAVLNDHGQDDPAWRDHTATFTPKLSLEWKRWTENNGASKSMPQSKFAAFIEDNLGDIATVSDMPTGSQMLEMALAFEATSEKRFKRRIDLQAGGVQLEYIDKADESTSAKFQMFERFTLGIPVFQGSANAYPMEARLKFRQAADTLSFWFELIRPDRVFRQAVTDEIGQIKEKTGFMLLYGNPGL